MGCGELPWSTETVETVQRTTQFKLLPYSAIEELVKIYVSTPERDLRDRRFAERMQSRLGLPNTSNFICVTLNKGMANVHVRKTTAADYDDVVRIREHLYNGEDYLPSQYHHLLETFTGFAGYVNDIMVGFLFAAVIDDGKSVLIKSVRVHKEYEGLGIYTRMREFCMKNLTQTTNRCVFVAVLAKESESLFRKSSQLIFELNILKITNTKASIQALLGPRHVPSSVRQVDAAFLKKIILTKTSKQFLFPENRIVVNCGHYEVIVENVERILSCSEMLATMNVNEDTVDTMHPLTISTCTSHQCEAGTTVIISFFGYLEDEIIVSDHVDTHVLRCVKSCDENLILYITYRKEHNTAALEHVLSKLKWRKVGEEVLLCMEMTVI